MSVICPTLVIIFLACSIKIALAAGGALDQFRDWRHGRAVDRTEAWKNCERTFKGAV